MKKVVHIDGFSQAVSATAAEAAATTAVEEMLKSNADYSEIRNSDVNKQTMSEPPTRPIQIRKPNRDVAKYKVIKNHSYTCYDCGDKVDGCDLEQHSDEHSTLSLTVNSYVQSKDSILCLTCNKTMSAQHFDVHKNVLHNPNLPTKWVEVKRYKCTVCGTQDVSKDSLRSHYANKHSDIPIEDTLFASFEIEARIQCPFCKFHFGDGRLERHVKQCHMEKMSKVIVCPSTEIIEEIIYLKRCECDFCGGKYVKDSIFKQCKSSNQSADFVARNVCGRCKEQFLVDQIKVAKYHEKRYYLKHVYKAKQKATADQELENPNTKMYICTICGCSSITEYCLEEHHSKWHTNIPKTTDIFRFVAIRLDGECSVCEENVSGKELKEHIEQFHPSTPVRATKNGDVERYTFLRYTSCEKTKFPTEDLGSTKNNNIPEGNNSRISATGLEKLLGHERIEWNGCKIVSTHQNGSASSLPNGNQCQQIEPNLSDFIMKLYNCRICGAKDIIDDQRFVHHLGNTAKFKSAFS
ncbi:uncharacterized protein LOC129579552 [Sitodiplosis mosellana]|uniref:uncharacterized protein LOC129579552 n=1 Tax=Sitodiplosis mosellana TaxID=263140 RepID=UPI002444DA5B|nr:uncharacterized protein LOC129579552 [Sitodiplosis mosellana]